MISITYYDKGRQVTVPLFKHDGKIDTQSCKKFLEQGKIDPKTQTTLLKKALDELTQQSLPENYKKMRNQIADKDREIGFLKNQIQSLSEKRPVDNADKRHRNRSTIRRNDEQIFKEELALMESEDLEE